MVMGEARSHSHAKIPSSRLTINKCSVIHPRPNPHHHPHLTYFPTHLAAPTSPPCVLMHSNRNSSIRGK